MSWYSDLIYGTATSTELKDLHANSIKIKGVAVNPQPQQIIEEPKPAKKEVDYGIVSHIKRELFKDVKQFSFYHNPNSYQSYSNELSSLIITHNESLMKFHFYTSGDTIKMQVFNPIEIIFDLGKETQLITDIADYLISIFPFFMTDNQYIKHRNSYFHVLRDYMVDKNKFIELNFSADVLKNQKHIEYYLWLYLNCNGKYTNIKGKRDNKSVFMTKFDDETDLMAVKINFSELLF